MMRTVQGDRRQAWIGLKRKEAPGHRRAGKLAGSGATVATGRVWVSLAVVLAALAAACSAVAPPAARETPALSLPGTIYVVRHAERSLEPPDDPHLSDAGYRRAALLAEQLRGEGVAAILSTDTRRTRETAAPLAEAYGIPVRIYNPGDPRSLQGLLADIDLNGRTVMVVGHSNTVPGIVESLTGDSVDPIDDDEYDRLYRLDRGGDGRFSARLIRFGQ